MVEPQCEDVSWVVVEYAQLSFELEPDPHELEPDPHELEPEPDPQLLDELTGSKNEELLLKKSSDIPTALRMPAARDRKNATYY